ncbi:XdhC family protein [Arenimonas daejeonensis]|uniref:XdhC family protein n=1 Tax=Arenimonas daejeonensis TaxID=370777 RepID=UPI0011BEA31F|nr:XdhC family protein [Arenimonas daejeonensis]
MSQTGGNRGVLERARLLRHEGHAFALALVTDTEGSTYRKPGALALVADDGSRLGTLSGGCLEPALDLLARRALDEDRPQVGVFDTLGDDDLLFGSGSGCRGRMRVVAWPVRPDAPHPLFEALLAAQSGGQALELAVHVDADSSGQGQAWFGHERFSFGLPSDPDVAGWPTGLHASGGRLIARLHVRPPPRLLLIGGGPEAPALLRLARTLGWYSAVGDHRPGLLDPTRLADADALTCARPAAVLASGSLPPDAVLVMTHLASADLEALRALAMLPVAYVGLLGPPGRRDELLAMLDDETRARLKPRLRAPVGLPLGGEGPEAIALAIAADLQRFFHGGP